MSSILITGSTGNLGKTLVKTLLDGGHQLHLPVRAINQENTTNVCYYQTDLTIAEQSEDLAKSIFASEQRIKAGVFLTGGFVSGKLDTTNIEDISKMIMLNFETAFTLSKDLISHFKSNGGGKLIFIGAKVAMESETAFHNLAYSLSKQLLFNFSLLINESENIHGITSHILLPRTLDTELNRSYMPDADFSTWTKTESITDTISKIIEEKETRIIINL